MKAWIHPLRARLPFFVAALWWGSLTVLAALVVPLLFANLPTPALAGNAAARLFTAQTWLGVACGLLLLGLCRAQAKADAQSAEMAATRWIVAGLLFALLLELAVAPRIVARENLPLWHSLGMTFYAMQWVSAGATLWWLLDARERFKSESAS